MNRTVGLILLGCLLGCGAPSQATACTAFGLDTPGGPVFATNCDLLFPGDGLVFLNRRGIAKEGYFRGPQGQQARWVSTYGSVTFNPAGREFVWGGMNEAGLVMSTLELKASECPRNDDRPPVSEGYLIQYVLDTCATAAEAVAAVESVRPWQSECFSHFLAVDARGEGVAFEYLDGELVVWQGASLPVKAMANMRYDRSLAALERGGPRWWWSNPGQSAQRVAAAAEAIRNYDAVRDTCAITYAFETLTRVVAAPHTRWNIVFDQAERQLWYRTDRSPAVKHIALTGLDLDCTAELLMLDVNTMHEGSIMDRFRPYDAAVNLATFQTFCDRWGIAVSDAAARGLMRLFEGFECAP